MRLTNIPTGLLTLTLLLNFIISQYTNQTLTSLDDPFDSIALDEDLESYDDTSSNEPLIKLPGNLMNNENRRIVHGRIADRPEQYPFLVAIAPFTYPKYIICGGTLINPYTIVSASHCNEHIRFEWFIVYNQVYNFTDQEQVNNGKTYEIIDFIQHPDYDPVRYVNDIAVLRLNKPIQLSEYITLDDGTIGTDFLHKVRVIGWGFYDTDIPKNSLVLRLADIQIFDNSICRLYMNMLLKVFISPVAHICAMQIGGQADSCTGDSGGPLIARVCGKWRFVGVVSFGHECGLATAPGVYTKVDHFLDWIKENTFHS